MINDVRYSEQAEIIRDKGTNRSRFVRGQVDKYTWVGLGSSYLPSDILAAILYAQLESRETIQAQRRHIWERYNMRLRDWAARYGVGTPVVPPQCQQPFHMFYLLLPSEGSRARLIRHLKARNILSVFHYLPLHLSEMGLRLGGRACSCPVTEDVSNRLLRLPFYNGLTETEQARVIRAVREFEPGGAPEWFRRSASRLYRTSPNRCGLVCTPAGASIWNGIRSSSDYASPG